jgi:two-component system KDP operon response regulator KdpE
MSNILILDDEPQIRRFLRISLSAIGHSLFEAETANSAFTILKNNKIDLVILDLGLPDLDGQEAISIIRGQTSVPIIVLSVRASETDKVEALDRGADDYVVKPFAIGELMARIRVSLRSDLALSQSQEKLVFEDLEIDFIKRRILRKGQDIHLSKKEYDLLSFLASQADHVVTHKHILKTLWGPAHTEDTAYLRVYIKQLRQKLEKDPTHPKIILTEAGIGYRLRLSETE